jgi:UDP-GlcNAc:undecaprenyl-phosphate GlcNAc-1-phosphate transferase
MGDTGATFLGYILACLSVTGLFKFYAIISFAVPFLILGVPIFDICFAFLRRIAKGQNPMVADRGHVHHRLIDMGFNQKQAVAILYVISGILGLSAVVLTTSGALKAMILLCALCLAGLIAVKISMGHAEPKQEEKEAADNGAESHDHLRDSSGSGEDGSSGEGAGEQT